MSVGAAWGGQSGGRLRGSSPLLGPACFLALPRRCCRSIKQLQGGHAQGECQQTGMARPRGLCHPSTAGIGAPCMQFEFNQWQWARPPPGCSGLVPGSASLAWHTGAGPRVFCARAKTAAQDASRNCTQLVDLRSKASPQECAAAGTKQRLVCPDPCLQPPLDRRRAWWFVGAGPLGWGSGLQPDAASTEILEAPRFPP